LSVRSRSDLDLHLWRNLAQAGIGKLLIPRKVFDEFAVAGCTNPDIQVHHVTRLHRKIGNFIVESI